jgi:hypothetical protein
VSFSLDAFKSFDFSFQLLDYYVDLSSA